MITVISHDAGGAEIISSYVRSQGLDCLYVLEGPARKIFERKLGAIETLPLDEAIQKSTSVLCGSGGADLEFNAIKLARSLGKHSVAFLDHWVNYRERFTRSGVTLLPDEIWVGDAMAEGVANELFPGVPIRLVQNPYVHDIQQELAATRLQRSPMPERISVLYVCARVHDHSLLLPYFLANVAVLGRPVERILIRPHPSEPLDKYDWIQHEFDLPIERGGAHTLLEEIAQSDVVVGCESMAMVIGLLAGKRVISCIPPEGKPCRLPHREIEKLHKLLKTNTTISESKRKP